ncbi:phosphoribosyl-ATP pyrophosphatase [Bacillus sp. 165]|nr:phosphoribosyl-ATP pyrophosphatase [Bacillus sp. 165]MBO9128365.1 phosphoribosyl-ATP pyrophosphatase [Bacillus sp. 165]
MINVKNFVIGLMMLMSAFIVYILKNKSPFSFMKKHYI